MAERKAMSPTSVMKGNKLGAHEVKTTGSRRPFPLLGRGSGDQLSG